MTKNALAEVRKTGAIGSRLPGIQPAVARRPRSDNVELPMLYSGTTKKTSERHKLAAECWRRWDSAIA
jgi:hypothetical protein